jgi:uncharacterized membrane protein YfhO
MEQSREENTAWIIKLRTLIYVYLIKNDMNLNISKKALYPLTLLIIPLLGVLISDSIDWGFFDFLMMGSLLLVLGIAINLSLLNINHFKKKMAIIFFLILIFLIIWVELAVGVFNTPFAGT